jgi:hypothetical protein
MNLVKFKELTNINTISTLIKHVGTGYTKIPVHVPFSLHVAQSTY